MKRFFKNIIARTSVRRLSVGLLIVLSAVSAFGETEAEQKAEAAFRSTVSRVRARAPEFGVREVFWAIYRFASTGRHLDALDDLLDCAAQMQDRVPTSRTYGNFRWYQRDGYVMDQNAVDFCMQTALRFTSDDLARLTAAQRAKFDELVRLGVIGCRAHRVRDSYTNIALLNASNLILLGERLNRAEAFAEGVKRLDAFVFNTALCGVCEYASPTYTAVDVEALHVLHASVRDAQVKATCAKLLTLFWTDLAASTFAGAGRLAGAHSRDYDYLYGLGGVPDWLRAAGFIPSAPNARDPEDFVRDTWRPTSAMRELVTRVPRFVVARWGMEQTEFRALWVGRHVALGTAGANYGTMDIPLAVDLAGGPKLARGYFIPDGRRDPYGRVRIPEGRGCHQKTLHLRPLWCGTQVGAEALGLAVYPSDTIPTGTATLESHFVFPRLVDELYVGDARVTAEPGHAFARVLARGEPVFARVGAGAFGVQVVGAGDVAGRSAPVALVWDDSSADCCRVTVAHHDFWGCHPAGDATPYAAFRVRVCDAAADAASFAAFRAAFTRAPAAVARRDGCLAVTAGGLSLVARTDGRTVERIEPDPRAGVLTIDGRDVGSQILGAVPGVAAYRKACAEAQARMSRNRILVSPRQAARWEAEMGAVSGRMVVAKDRRASGGAFVWAPGEVGAGGGGPGHVSWQLDVQEAGTYYLWGRVMAPTPSDDSFLVKVTTGDYAKDGIRGRPVLPRTVWSTGVTGTQWRGRRFPQALTLPKGPVVLTFEVREDGTKIDRLLLSADERGDGFGQ